MARKRDILGDHEGVDNSPLGTAVGDAGTWGLPSDEGLVGQSPAMLWPPAPSDDRYSDGILVGASHDADAAAADQARIIGARVDAPRSFQLPHEATHRRFEPPLIVKIAQTAAGFTLIAAPNQGLHYVKLIACHLTLSAGGTLRFVQGSSDGTNVLDMTGNLAMGGAAVAPMTLPPADLQNPWLYTAPDQALGIFTATGLAAGWAIVCYSPYDS